MSDVVRPAAAPKPYTLQREPGGRLPELGPLVSATLGEFTDNLGPYALAGLGMFLVRMVTTMIMLPLFYVVVFGVAFGGMIATALVSVGVSEASGSDDAGALVGVFGQLGSMVAMMLAMFAMVGAVAAFTAPLTGSLQRAIAAQQRGDAKLDLGAGFSTALQGLPSAMLVAGLYMTAVLLGAMACYVPALGVMFLASFAPTFVFLHQRGAVDAFRRSSAHALANTSYYVPFVLVFFALSMVSAYVPIVGPMFAVALHVRAFREMFGDDPEA